jgi:hypothetical protein
VKVLFETWASGTYEAPGCVDFSATAYEYRALAKLIRAGGGTCAADAITDTSGAVSLSSVQVSTTPGAKVLIAIDETALHISGDLASLATLAANLESMADSDDGGHMHDDYYPGHFYLARGTASLIINSPHGGMPLR